MEGTLEGRVLVLLGPRAEDNHFVLTGKMKVPTNLVDAALINIAKQNIQSAEFITSSSTVIFPPIFCRNHQQI
jgi:hypothetical protein